MGDFFNPNITPVSTVSGPQNTTQWMLSSALGGMMTGKSGEELQKAFREILMGSPTDISDIEKGAFRTFREKGIPAINAQAAGISGIQNSRRIGEIARSAGDITSTLAGLRAQMSETARNRQLGAIGLPLQIGSGFSTQSTVDSIAEPSLLAQTFELVGTGITAAGNAASK